MTNMKLISKPRIELLTTSWPNGRTRSGRDVTAEHEGKGGIGRKGKGKHG